MATQLINPKLIKPNPFQPRLTMDAAAIAELAASIREHGLIQPGWRMSFFVRHVHCSVPLSKLRCHDDDGYQHPA